MTALQVLLVVILLIAGAIALEVWLKRGRKRPLLSSKPSAAMYGVKRTGIHRVGDGEAGGGAQQDALASFDRLVDRQREVEIEEQRRHKLQQALALRKRGEIDEEKRNEETLDRLSLDRATK